jgi:hypothetical protein
MIQPRSALNQALSLTALPDGVFGEECIPVGSSSPLEDVLVAWYTQQSARVDAFLDAPDEEAEDVVEDEEYDEDEDEFGPCAGHSSNWRKKYKSKSKTKRKGKLPAVPEGDEDASQSHLDARDFKFTGLHPKSPIPSNIMELVLTKDATREQLWLIEGALIRLMMCTEDGQCRMALVKLWACVYKAKSGLDLQLSFFALVDAVVDIRYELLACRPQTSMQVTHSVFMDLRQEEEAEWRCLFKEIFDLRSRWKYPADLMCCGVHPPYQCPVDVSFDREWHRSEGGRSYFDEERRTDGAARAAANPVFRRGKDLAYCGKRRRFDY